MNLIFSVKRIAAVLIALVLCVGVTGVQTSYSVKDSSIKLNLTAFADVHMEGNNRIRRNIFTKSLMSLKGSESNIDALVLLGDNTMNGQNIEYMFLYGILANRCPVNTVLPVIGNHDYSDGDAAQQKARFINYYNGFSGDDISAIYYCKVINGCYLIFFGGDWDDDFDCCSFSDSQLDWLEETVDKAADEGCPIMVFSHHPSSYVNAGAERYAEILTSQENIFVFDGHMHYYIASRTLRGEYETPETFIPCLTITEENSNSVIDESGYGAQIEVYGDRVDVRFRNYLTGEWLAESYSFEIN